MGKQVDVCDAPNAPWSGKRSLPGVCEVEVPIPVGDSGPEASQPSEDLRSPSACVYVVQWFSGSFVELTLRVSQCRSAVVSFLNDDTLDTSHARPDNSQI